jgi:aminoglycoside/choline kinase family phosphotransferase
MDAPPEQEDCRPFIDIAGHLATMGLNSPRILQADVDNGFLLLSDLGSVQYLEAFEAGDAAEPLYNDALDALLKMQTNGWEFQAGLPPYDEALLRFEMSLFHDWLCVKHLDLSFSKDDESAWQATCDVLADNALEQETVFVHRDYHSRNLMVTEQDNPGVLDFQDAVEGPYTYDLVSLIKDCYVKWPAEKIEAFAHDYFDKQTFEHDIGRFVRHYELMGVQRHLKAAGIFARLLHRDGKSGYLKDVPRTLSYIVDVVPRYPELAALGQLITERVLPSVGKES